MLVVRVNKAFGERHERHHRHMGRPPKPVDTSTFTGRFAVRLRELRENAGLTVEEFAVKVSENGYPINTRTAYNWECDTKNPPICALPAIATALSVSVRTVLPKT